MKSAIIGCGSVAPVHIEGIKACGIEIAALCDMDISRAQSLSKNYSLEAQAFADWREMLDTSDVDCVHICTPHDLHVPMAVCALKKNINVLLEKPAASCANELELLLDAEKNSDAKLGICLQNRYLPGNIAVKNLLDCESGPIKAELSLQWNRNIEYFKSAAWRASLARSGGGALINQAIHSLDLLIWFLGEVQSVTCKTDTVKFKGLIENEDYAEGIIKFKKGIARFEVSIAAQNNEPVTTKIEGKHNIVLSAGNLMLDGKQMDFGNMPYSTHKDYWGVGHSLLIADFYDCVQSGKPFAINGVEGAKSASLVFECYRANARR